MLWNRNIHTKLVSLLESLPQQNYAEIPLSDGDDLLDNNIRFLPLYECHVAGYLFEDGNMGYSTRSRACNIGIRAIFLAELSLARTREGCATMVHARTPDVSDSLEPLVRLDPYPRDCWVCYTSKLLREGLLLTWSPDLLHGIIMLLHPLTHFLL